MRTGSLAFSPRTGKLQPPSPLPNVADQPRAAFLNGWWSGIGVGIVIGCAIGVLIAKGV